jgi:hypothetical protein
MEVVIYRAVTRRSVTSLVLNLPAPEFGGLRAPRCAISATEGAAKYRPRTFTPVLIA